MDIDIDNRQSARPIDAQPIRQAAEQILTFMKAPAGSELSIVLVDDAAIQRLNREYRGIDRSTDVLSFAQQETLDTQAVSVHHADDEMPVVLGDVILSVETTARQADEHHATFQQELSALLTHGILHLLGYDHITDDDAAVMEGLERQIATSGLFGLP